MPRFLCLQRNLPSSEPREPRGDRPSPAQMQAMYNQFNEWRTRFADNLVDLGGRLGAGKVAVPEPAPDGPFVELKELVGGYMVVSAVDLDEALAIVRGCPGLVRPGSGCEVIEIHAPA